MHASSTGLRANASQPGPAGRLVLVAGGTGFIGSAVVRALASTRRVTVLARDATRARKRFEAAELDVDIRQGDVTNPDSLDHRLDGVDTVVQCVQFTGFPVEAPARRLTFMDVDAAGTRALLDAARAQDVRKIVYLSGVGADPHARQPWFRAKGIAEASVRSSGLAFAIVRPSWTYGPGDRSLNRFIAILKTVPGFFPQVGRGDQRLNPVFVGDVARVVSEAASGDILDGTTVEIGGLEVLTLDEVLRASMRAIGREKPIVHIPLAFALFGARMLEALPGQILSADAVRFLTQSAVADLQVLRDRLPGFGPLGLDEALATYV